MFRKINKQCIISGILILCFVVYGCSSDPKPSKLTAPNLTSPDNSELMTDNTPMFEWTDSVGALEYIIEVDNNSDFLSPQINATINISTYTPDTGLSAGLYWWRVKARDGDGNTSEWTQSWEFTIIDEMADGNCPNAPTDIDIYEGYEEITIKINDLVLGATGFNIYMDTNMGVSKTSYAEKKSIKATSYTWKGLTNGTVYYFVVTSENTNCESDESFEVSGVPKIQDTLPIRPANVSAIAGDGQITIVWKTVLGASSYTVYWLNVSGVDKSDNKISKVTSPYTHVGLTNGTTYYYVVTASNTVGESDISDEKNATPKKATILVDPPINVKAIANDGQVTISWDTESEVNLYNIYWSYGSDVSTSDNKIENVTSPYTHTDLINDITYYYIVTSVNSVGESGISNEVSATPQSSEIIPNAPTNVGASSGNTKVTISWDLVTGASSYNIYWSNSIGVSKSDNKIANVTRPYTHTNLINRTTYYYVLTAVNLAGESIISSEVSAMPQSQVVTSDKWDTMIWDTGVWGD